MLNSMTRLPTRNDVIAAYDVIKGHIRETPVLRTPAADFGLTGQPLTFKLEFMQHAGTFKPRGAFTNLLMRGGEGTVVAASGGNHGAAVAYAAVTLGRRARIYVPTIASRAKIEKIRSYGAEVIVGGERYAEALQASNAWLAANGGSMVHAYDQFETLAGQGTLALELARQAPEIETLLVAVGGGGLIGGIAAYYAGDVKVVGVETEGCPTLHEALRAGKPVDTPVGGIAADSLGAPKLGSLTFPIAQQYVAGSVLVTDEAVVAAQALLWDKLRIVVEPGGAAAFAALLSGRYVPEPNERVGVLLCGANTGALPAAKAAN